MKLLCLVLISSLAFFWTADADCTKNSQCNNDECCINITHEGECRKLGTKGEKCSPFVSRAYYYYCGCQEGLTCVPDNVPAAPGSDYFDYFYHGPLNSGTVKSQSSGTCQESESK